jgi:hypothetical protein
VAQVTPQRANTRRAAASIACRVAADSCLVLRIAENLRLLREFTYNHDCI